MRNKKMKKNVIAILTATIILLSSLGPLILTTQAVAPDPASWYRTVYGNLDSDTYVLYPYLAKSLNIGFSKFGELIDGNTEIGLAYGDTDAFATNETAPPEYQWIEGWILNITYVEGGQYKNVWAIALYSDYQDLNGIGGNWVENVTTGSINLASRGGRRTSGGAVTDDIQVLYDGPRRYVALTRTTIYSSSNHLVALATVTITIDFNKVKKYVTLIKDVKRIDVGKNIGNMQFEFGDRGEWDLAAGSPPRSYGKIYNESSITTVYDSNWQPWYNTTLGIYNGTYTVAQIIDDEYRYAGWAAFWPRPITTWIGATQEEADRTTILTSISTVTEDQLGTGSKLNFTLLEEPAAYPQNNSGVVTWIEDPMVFLDGQHKTLVTSFTDPSRQVKYDRNTNTVMFPTGYAPALDAVVRIVYKVDRTKTEMSSEPNSPFVIGEWCWETNSAPSQFRGVTVYGITDCNDGDDKENVEGQHTDLLDREVKYQLDEVFNPWDLYSSIHKKTDRWIEYVGPGYTGWISDHSPVMDVSDDMWDQYAVFSERVVDLNESILLNRYLGDYDFTVDPDDGHALITGLNSTHWYEITYSTDTEYVQDTFEVTHTVVNSSYLLGQTIDWDWFYAPSLDAEWEDMLNVAHDVYPDEFSFEIMNMSTSAFPTDENVTWTYSTNELEWGAEPFKVFKEDSTSLEIGSSNWETMNVTEGEGLTLQFHIDELELNWDIEYQPEGPLFTDLRDVHFYLWDFDVWPTIEVMWNNATRNITITATLEYISDNGREAPLYVEVVPGRYEWGVVGKNAASVDSAGLSLVSAAFKNKQVEYGLAGADMYDARVDFQMPWVMNKVGAGTASTDYYYYNYGEGYANDYRTALRSNWCTTWPVTSSNMITVGGPFANMLSYYENDFSEAFYGLSQFTSDPVWQNHIVARTCWWGHNTAHAYTSSNSTGYGVITAYLDLNGTVVLQLWGYWGRDTYYLTKWFHEYGIWQLQSSPYGLTSIVVKIPYTSYPEGYKPGTVTIPECLGTISERTWYHDGQTKGGIHDP
jgi:hypothetical protein